MKYKVVVTGTLQIVGEGDDPEQIAKDFDMRSHVMVREFPVMASKKVDTKIEPQVSTVWWDFGAMSAHKKKLLVRAVNEENFINCKNLINEYKIAVICCSGQMEQIKDNVKQAQKDGILPVSIK